MTAQWQGVCGVQCRAVSIVVTSLGCGDGDAESRNRTWSVVTVHTFKCRSRSVATASLASAALHGVTRCSAARPLTLHVTSALGISSRRITSLHHRLIARMEDNRPLTRSVSLSPTRPAPSPLLTYRIPLSDRPSLSPPPPLSLSSPSPPSASPPTPSSPVLLSPTSLSSVVELKRRYDALLLSPLLPLHIRRLRHLLPRLLQSPSHLPRTRLARPLPGHPHRLRGRCARPGTGERRPEGGRGRGPATADGGGGQRGGGGEAGGSCWA